MDYVVYGTGAVGGVIGGHLHLAGSPVTLVARGAHLEAIRAGGLVLDAGDGRHRIDAPATDTAADVAWTDDTVVILAVKSHQAAVALADLREHAPPGTAIVCATNGIATEVAALRLFARTYAVCVMLPSTHLEPGVVVAGCHPTPAILDIGRVPGGTDATTAAVAADLHAAAHRVRGARRHHGVEAPQARDEPRQRRRRLVRPGRRGRRAGRARPGRGRARARGGGPQRRDRRRGPRTPWLDPPAPYRPRAAGGSTWQSLARGTGDSEIDYLAGEIVLQGRLHGVPTPVNEAVVAATRALAYAGASPRSLDAAEVLARL